MLTLLGLLTVTIVPCVVAIGLLVARWVQGRRQEALRRQIALTDAIHREFGAIVDPVVTKPLWGPWQIRIAVPFAQPATVGTVLSVAHRVLSFADRMNPGRYQIVLTSREEPGRRTQSAAAAAFRQTSAPGWRRAGSAN